MASILVAEDERDIAVLIRFLLEQEGHAVDVARDGLEVLEKLGIEPASDLPVPDLAILDLMMPLLDGASVCRRLAENPRTKAMPLLVLSGKGEVRAAIEKLPGVRAMLSKPFDPRAFRESVNAALGKPRLMSTIMIVDDEAEIITLLRFLFEKEGHKVTEALNGQEACERLGLEPADPSQVLPDLLILDIMMPIMDGYTLNTRLQATERTKSIPIIVLTAKGERMRDLFEMAPNVAAYVRKPFEPKVLRDLVSGILTKKRT